MDDAADDIEALCRELETPIGHGGQNSEDGYEIHDPLRLKAAAALRRLAGETFHRHSAHVAAEEERGAWKARATAAASPAATDEEVAALLRPFLVDDCGCSPRCRCDEEGALRIWKEDARDAIRTAFNFLEARNAR